MSELTFSSKIRSHGSRGGKAATVALPHATMRFAGVALALAISTAHVADQGGISLFTSPDWLGWAYRLIEVGGVLTALALLSPRTERLGWTAGIALGALPFLGYLASRTVGVPGDAGDIGNWGDWVGTFALIVELGMVTLATAMLEAARRTPAPPAPQNGTAEQAGLSNLDAWSMWLPMNLK